MENPLAGGDRKVPFQRNECKLMSVLRTDTSLKGGRAMKLGAYLFAFLIILGILNALVTIGIFKSLSDDEPEEVKKEAVSSGK